MRPWLTYREQCGAAGIQRHRYAHLEAETALLEALRAIRRLWSSRPAAPPAAPPATSPSRHTLGDEDLKAMREDGAAWDREPTREDDPDALDVEALRAQRGSSHRLGMKAAR